MKNKIGCNTANIGMNFKHICAVKKGERIYFDDVFYVATDNATLRETEHGYEWGVDVEGGTRMRLCSCDFHNGFVVAWSI